MRQGHRGVACHEHSVASSSPAWASSRRSATTLATAWDSIINGRSGIGPITHFDADRATPRASPAKCATSTPRPWVAPKDAKKMDTFIHYGLAASMHGDGRRRAGDHRGQRRARRRADRLGHRRHARHRGDRDRAARGRPAQDLAVLRAQHHHQHGLRASCASSRASRARISPRCRPAPSSNHSIGMAMRMIQYGDADVMVAGGAEHGSTPTSVGGFCSMKALSHAQRRTDPRQPSLGPRPRRLRARRRRRHPGARGVRDGQGARRAHLLRAGRLRRQLRRVPHDRAERERRRPGALHGDGDATTPASTPTRSNTSTRTAPRRRSATSPRRRR